MIMKSLYTTTSKIELWLERNDDTGENTGRFYLNLFEAPDRDYGFGVIVTRDELVELKERINRALTNA